MYSDDIFHGRSNVTSIYSCTKVILCEWLSFIWSIWNAFVEIKLKKISRKCENEIFRKNFISSALLVKSVINWTIVYVSNTVSCLDHMRDENTTTNPLIIRKHISASKESEWRLLRKKYYAHVDLKWNSRPKLRIHFLCKQIVMFDTNL